MLIGYARVSTEDQNLDGQVDQLQKIGCEKIFKEHASGTSKDRKELAKAVDQLRKGDTFVVCSLDRLGRSVKQLIEFVNDLKKIGVAFRSIREAIDTETPTGKFFFHVTAAFAELERNLIQERTKVGLAAARARGRKGGRKRVIDDKKFQIALQLYEENKTPVTDICKSLGIAKRTFYRYLEEHKQRSHLSKT
ncbi:recombinase family protein [Candidatus Uabimicrobium amorphum]|uniref:DNA invertase n=1 Tax=Uabimicrobium amorphum TaxID=2596890 RepID=A0A5S9F5I4_UABAM|nr:recombinase family protein [Candidatus Uabimicrobium amorphum]BBM86648.1 DNA invertase [Candidatus Uabimicrobium amorphum]